VLAFWGIMSRHLKESPCICGELQVYLFEMFFHTLEVANFILELSIERKSLRKIKKDEKRY